MTFQPGGGSANERITIDGGDFSKTQKPLSLKNNATATAIKIRN